MDSDNSHLEGQRPSRLPEIFSMTLLVMAVLFVPARVGFMGHMPADDALRHAAKVVSGKNWDQILVLRDEVKADSHAGWHFLLGALHKGLGVDRYGLVAFEVTFCFAVLMLLPLFFLGRPEAWLLSMLGIMALTPWVPSRYLMGRPFLVTMAVFVVVCLKWKKLAGDKTPWGAIASFSLAIGIAAWLQPATYLFAVPVFCFVLAREWRVAIRLTACVVLGAIMGLLLSGHPLLLLQRLSHVLFRSPNQAILSRMLATELRPVGGTGLALFFAISALLMIRAIRKRWDPKALDNPILYMAIAGQILGHMVGRFWYDWGMVAGVAWVAVEINAILQEGVGARTWKRLGLNALIAASFVIVVTSDLSSRWTRNVPSYPLSYSASMEKEWFPESGGIMYGTSMLDFYRTFFHNPHAPWRYVLGFEPALMLPEDLRVFRKLQESGGTAEDCRPWLNKMLPADRMVHHSAKGKTPPIDALEWHYMTRNTWLGRLPRKTETKTDSPVAPTE